MTILHNRTVLRIACFATAIALALMGGVYAQYHRAEGYRQQLELNQRRALQETSTSLNSISVELRKGVYAGTADQSAGIAAKIAKDAGAAKSSLSTLPTGDLHLEGTYRFLSQVGDYALYLSRKSVRGEPLTAEERENLQILMVYARELSQGFSALEQRVSSGEILLEDLFVAVPALPDGDAFPVSAMAGGGGEGEPDGFLSLEEGFDGYPTLIYDGPFSDNLLEKSPVMTKDLPEITRVEAQKIAARFAGVGPLDLREGDDEHSRMPSYTFSNSALDIGVTKQGGLVTYLIAARGVGERGITNRDARDRAAEFLQEMEIGHMAETYYQVANGVLTVNFAYKPEEITHYTDLIKVGVALDNGDIVFYDARGFINNHKDRELLAPALSRTKARQSVSSALEVKSSGLALIPTDGGNEVLAYEFRCKGLDDDQVLVYVNAETGAEERILILIESENGVLTV